MKRRTRSTAPQHRLGFTLIELLVVIVILAILIGLLVPAVMRAVATAKDAAVAAEIRAMSQALADFHSKFNSYPPSRIIISENGDYSTTTLSAYHPALIQRSLKYLRQYWPRMSINTAGGAAAGINTANNGQFYDVNGNGIYDGDYMLYGTECLVLFLGGLPQGTSGGSGWAMTGFSKNPANPFQNSLVTTNRTIPLFEFDNSRLVSIAAVASGTFPGYIDSLGSTSKGNTDAFYCYFSAYGGVGYDPGDIDFAESNPAGNRDVVGAFTSTNAPTSVPYGSGNIVTSPAPNPYTNDVPVSTFAGSGAVNPDGKSHAWQNAQTFQIISSGNDRLYGMGGQYLANGNDRLPYVYVTTGSGYLANSLQTSNANDVVVSGLPMGPDVRAREKDNVTNFSAGKLD